MIPPQTGADDQLQSPAELTVPDWKETLRRTIKEFKSDRATLLSAGMAFYWFLAIFPALIAAVGIFRLFEARPEATESLNEAIRTTLPPGAADVLSGALTQPRSGGASLWAAVVGLALALFSASAGMVALQNGMDLAYDVPAERERKYVAKRARALVLMVVALVLGGVATVFTVFGRPLGKVVEDALPVGGGAFVAIWTVLRWVLGVGVFSVLFAAFYYLGPSRDSPRWSWLSPGGVLGAVIWLASSLGFSFYVSSVGSYARTYGSFAGLVVLLLWLYLSAIAVVLGAELNAELERQSAIRAGQVPDPAGARAPRDRGATATPATAPEPAPNQRRTADPGRSEWATRMEELRKGR